MNCDHQITLHERRIDCHLSKGHDKEHRANYAVSSSEGLTSATVQWASKALGMRIGRRVRMEDGRLGKLSTPRGCYCGPNKEECWDITLDEGRGIQAQGGTFSPVENTQNT